MTSAGEPKGLTALTALTELARDSVHPPTSAQLDRGLDALSARLAGEQSRRHGWLRWSLAGATAAAAVGLVAFVLRSPQIAPQPAPLSYRIAGGSVGDGGYLRDSGHDGIKVSFSEGTELAFLPGSRGRLRSVDAAGARIAIEQGTATFQVTPRQDAKWLVDVGPFLVTVTGTVFEVSWDPAAERFELRLRHGRVTVGGPISGGDIALRAGQRLTVDLPKAETVITEQRPDDWQPATPPAAVHPTEPAPVHPEATRAPARTSAPAPSLAPKPEPERRWAEALAAGRMDQILAEARRAGLKSTLEKASTEDLFALATAARYRRQTGLAREALLAERRRFPSSERALDAAFLLGRLEEGNDGGLARAIAWYDLYLTHAADGTYAAEALGRKMIVTGKLEGVGRAEPLAEEYLRRFPSGSYAGSARALRRAP